MRRDGRRSAQDELLNCEECDADLGTARYCWKCGHDNDSVTAVQVSPRASTDVVRRHYRIGQIDSAFVVQRMVRPTQGHQVRERIIERVLINVRHVDWALAMSDMRERASIRRYKRSGAPASGSSVSCFWASRPWAWLACLFFGDDDSPMRKLVVVPTYVSASSLFGEPATAACAQI